MVRFTTLVLFLAAALPSIIAAPTSDVLAGRQATRASVINRLQHPAQRAEPSNLPPPPVDILFRLRIPTDSELVARRGYYFSGLGLYAKPIAKATTVSDATVYRLVGGTGRFEASTQAAYDLYTSTDAENDSALPFAAKTEMFSPGLAFVSCNVFGTTLQCADPGTGGRAFGVDESGALRFAAAARGTKVYPVVVQLL